MCPTFPQKFLFRVPDSQIAGTARKLERERENKTRGIWGKDGSTHAFFALVFSICPFPTISERTGEFLLFLLDLTNIINSSLVQGSTRMDLGTVNIWNDAFLTSAGRKNRQKNRFFSESFLDWRNITDLCWS